MAWYLAKIVYRIICGNGNHTAQFDEQLRVIIAADEQGAAEKANCIGQNEQETFYNEKKQLVQWKFVNVSELYPLSELTDGAELYSRIVETDDPDDYLHIIQQRAAALRDEFQITYQQSTP